jgi:hypothetical protein
MLSHAVLPTPENPKPALAPIKILCLPVDTSLPALVPTIKLYEPVVMFLPA